MTLLISRRAVGPGTLGDGMRVRGLKSWGDSESFYALSVIGASYPAVQDGPVKQSAYVHLQTEN
jgi:hypothetical protein